MIRFVAAIATLLFLAMAIMARTAGMLGFALVGIVVCATIAVFAFAAARIDNSARDHVYVPTPEEAELMKKRAQRQRAEFEQKRVQTRAGAPAAVAKPASGGDGVED